MAEDLFSSKPSSPTLEAASASPSSQPTYTTAGTLYKAESSQRLQPPARRGRVVKSSFDLVKAILENARLASSSGFPDADLESTRSEERLNVLAQVIQYLPLQQNYDRAVSPSNDPDCTSDEMLSSAEGAAAAAPPLTVPASAAPGLVDEEALSPPLLFPEKMLDPSSSDDEDDSLTNALMNMTVKSLQNLASYPNPNQKSAQKVLLRGSRVKSGGSNSSQGAPSRLSTPSINRFNNNPLGRYLPAFSGDKSHFKSSASFDLVAPRPTGYVGLRGAPRLVASEAGPSFYHRSNNVSRVSTPFMDSESLDFNFSSMYSGLSTGPGAPKPLTAGPPGQRQYRSSTFESTFKALNTMPTTPQQTSFSEGEKGSFSSESFFSMLKTLPASSSQRSLTDDEECLETVESVFRALGDAPKSFESASAQTQEEDNNPLIPPDSLLYLTLHSEPEYPPVEIRSQMASMWPNPVEGKEKLFSYFDAHGQGFFNPGDSFYPSAAGPPPLSTIWHPSYGNNEWREPTAPMFPPLSGCAPPRTESEIQERSLRLNIHWYAATGLLGDALAFPKPVAAVAMPPVPKNIYGAVGDGRPPKGSSAARREGSWPSSSMSSKSTDNDISVNLALLDEVLSRAL